MYEVVIIEPTNGALHMTFGIAIKTSTPDGAAFMAGSIRAYREKCDREIRMARVLSALESHRKTQANARRGVRGYYASPADSRAEVRAAIAWARGQ